MTGLLLFAGLALAQMPPAPRFELSPSPMQRELAELCLPSSLKVVARTEAREPVVAATLVLSAGPQTDAPGKEGASLLLERVWARARADGQPETRDRLTAMGALWTTHRTPDTVVFAAEAPSDRLGDLLAVQGSRFAPFLDGVSDAVIAEEKAALALALAAGGPLDDVTLGMGFPAGFHAGDPTPVRALPTPASVAALTRADLVAAATAWKPGGTTLLVAGDVRMAELTKALEGSFPKDALFQAPDGSRPSRGVCPVPRHTPLDTPSPRNDTSPEVTAAPGPVAEPRLLLGWSLPPAYGDQEGLGRLAEKYLERRVVADFVAQSVARQVRYDPVCRYVPGPVASALTCALRLPEGTDPAVLAQKILQVLAVSNLVPTAEDGEIEFWRIGGAQELSLGIGELPLLRGPHAVREALQLHHRASPVWYGAAIGATAGSKVPDVRLFLGRWLAVKQAAAHVVVPPHVDPATVLAWKGKPDLSGLEGERLRPAERLDAWELPLSDRGQATVGPDASAPLAPRLDGMREETLPNGTRLVVLPYGSMPVVHVAAVTNVPDDTSPVVGLGEWLWEVYRPLVDTLPGGNTNYARLGARVEAKFFAGGAPSARTFEFQTTSGHLDPALWMLRHLVTEVEVDSRSDIRAERRYAAEDAWNQGASQPVEAARRARGTALFGERHPLTLGAGGRLLEGSRAPDKVQRSRFAHLWGAPQVTVLVVGGVDPDDALTRARAMFSSFGTRKAAEPGAPVTVEEGGADGLLSRAFPRPGATSEVTLACRVDAGADAEVAEVGREVLLRLVTRALAGLPLGRPLDLVTDAWGETGLVELTAVLRPEDADAAVSRLTALHGSLSGAADAALVAGAADTVARRDVLAWGEPEEVIDRLAAWGPGAAAKATARPSTLRGVTAAQVGAWLAPCTARAALTHVGPEAKP